MTVVERRGLASSMLEQQPRSRSRLRSLAGVAGCVLLPVLAALIAFGVFGVAHVENDSMSPTLSSGDIIVFDRVFPPSRGDVVLFADGGGWSSVAGATLVKRVIGVAGDTVVCCETGTGRLLVNGGPVDESYVSVQRPGGVVPFRVTVPADSVWVMGDNREASVDSRSGVSAPGRGGVPLADIRGVIRGIFGTG